jgi:hypothetical protein
MGTTTPGTTETADTTAAVRPEPVCGVVLLRFTNTQARLDVFPPSEVIEEDPLVWGRDDDGIAVVCPDYPNAIDGVDMDEVDDVVVTFMNAYPGDGDVPVLTERQRLAVEGMGMETEPSTRGELMSLASPNLLGYALAVLQEVEREACEPESEDDLGMATIPDETLERVKDALARIGGGA